jgi:PAS domain S-box-containing protein
VTDSAPLLPAEPDGAFRQASLKTIALLIGLSATLLVPLVYLSSGNPLEVWTTGLVALIGWVAYALVRLGYTTFLPLLTVYSVLTAACLSVLAFGSVRSAGGFMFVSAVAGAGIFLGRTALIGSVVFSVAALGTLTLAESQGWLHTPQFTVGITVWIVHSAVLITVAFLVFYSRSRAEAAFKQQLQELALRKRTEQERDRSNERFVRIFRTSPSPMLAQSARSGAILDANPAFERCYGYSREQVLGRTDTFLWADQAQRARYLERLIGHRRTDQEQATSLRADGQRFEALISSEMGDDPEDRLVITTVTDITAQNEALERVRRSEERFAKAFNFSPLKMTITRLSDGTFVEVNQARDPVQGFGREQLLGKSTLATGGWLSPQERQAFVEIIQREGHVSGYETRMRHANGEVIDAKMWAERIEIDGEDCILSCFVNTSEEKRREAQLLTLTRGIAGPIGNALFSALTLHMAQAIGADMVSVGELGVDEHLRTLAVWKDGAPAGNLTVPLEGSPCAVALGHPDLCVFESGLSQQFAQHPIITSEGFQAYIGQSLCDEDGTPIGLLNAYWRQPVQLGNETRALIAIFASRANAELVRLHRDREIQRLNAGLERRVHDRTTELRKLNAELDSFSYSVSHDLKSPLRTIDGFTRLLGEQLGGRLQPEEQVLFERVLGATRRMSTLIADMLALARVSQGPLELSAVDLSAMANQILQIEQEKCPERTLRWQIAPGLTCHCDERLARIALENLLGNSVKYTSKRPDPLIELGQLDGEAGGPGELFVRDNGVGFDMAHADKLFKPFQRLHMPSEFEGTGIGLATVHRIVERHGGSICGEAEPGAGATFRFSLSEVPRLGTTSPLSASPSPLSAAIEDSRSGASLIDGEVG